MRLGITFLGVDEMGKLGGIANEEHRSIVRN